jgi:uncharacterized Zn-finger protein
MCVTSLNRSAVQRFRGRELPFSSYVCKKSFTGRHNLQNHIRVHTGERPFSCEMCKKMFAQLSNLNRHLRVHSGERPFSCELCKKTLSQKSSLKNHLRLHSWDRHFSCKVCKKMFTRRFILKTRLRLHSGERPFSCKVCKKRFTRRYLLNKHLKSHSAEKPFSCNMKEKVHSRGKILKPSQCIPWEMSFRAQQSAHSTRHSESTESFDFILVMLNGRMTEFQMDTILQNANSYCEIHTFFFFLVCSRMESILNCHKPRIVFVLNNPTHTVFLFSN